MNDEVISSWLDDPICNEHRLFIMKKILYAKIHKKCKLLTEKTCSTLSKINHRKRKLAILQGTSGPQNRKKFSPLQKVSNKLHFIITLFQKLVSENA